MKKIYYCFPEGKRKALTMSYDDGRKQDIPLIELFNQYGIRSTFNLNYGLMGTGERIPKEKVYELYRGHEVATHTLTHPMLSRCSMARAAEEILEDRRGLEELVGYVVRGHAYPFGDSTPEMRQLFSGLGIAYGRTVSCRTDFALPEDPMVWQPTCRHKDPKLMDYARYFAEYKSPHYLKLMYVWGHSYEFDEEDNWEIIREFCRFMGGREDIWYATNIEIIDYLKVLKELQYTASGDMVYNPSVSSAWLEADGLGAVEVKGGMLQRF